MAAATAFDPDRLEALAADGLRAAREADTAGVAVALARRAGLLEALSRMDPGQQPGMDADRIRAALERVQAVDAETERLLREHSGRIREELREIGRGRRGLSGYGGRAPGTGSRIDERG